MKQATSPKKIPANENSSNKQTDQSDSPIKRCKYFEEYSGNSSPFDIQADTDYQEDVFAGAGVSICSYKTFSFTLPKSLLYTGVY